MRGISDAPRGMRFLNPPALTSRFWSWMSPRHGCLELRVLRGLRPRPWRLRCSASILARQKRVRAPSLRRSGGLGPQRLCVHNHLQGGSISARHVRNGASALPGLGWSRCSASILLAWHLSPTHPCPALSSFNKCCGMGELPNPDLDRMDHLGANRAGSPPTRGRVCDASWHWIHMQLQDSGFRICSLPAWMSK